MNDDVLTLEACEALLVMVGRLPRTDPVLEGLLYALYVLRRRAVWSEHLDHPLRRDYERNWWQRRRVA